MTNAVLVHSIPSFLLGIVLILLFAVWLGLLPSGGGPSLRHLILPAAVIGLSHAGVVARFVRSSTLEVLAQPYIKVAGLKPLPRWYFISAHVLPGTALPLLTLVGFSLGAMIGGAAIVESIFAWPGVGRFLVSSVARRDVAVVADDRDPGGAHDGGRQPADGSSLCVVRSAPARRTALTMSLPETLKVPYERPPRDCGRPRHGSCRSVRAGRDIR